MSVRWPEAVQPGETESREIPLSDRKPEKPADGKPAKMSGQIRKTERANPAPYKDKDKKRGAQARAAAGRRSPPDGGGVQPPAPDGAGAAVLTVDPASLSPLQADQIRRGASCMVAGHIVLRSSPQMVALQSALRSFERGDPAVWNMRGFSRVRR